MDLGCWQRLGISWYVASLKRCFESRDNVSGLQIKMDHLDLVAFHSYHLQVRTQKCTFKRMTSNRFSDKSDWSLAGNGCLGQLGSFSGGHNNSFLHLRPRFETGRGTTFTRGRFSGSFEANTSTVHPTDGSNRRIHRFTADERNFILATPKCHGTIWQWMVILGAQAMIQMKPGNNPCCRWNTDRNLTDHHISVWLVHKKSLYWLRKKWCEVMEKVMDSWQWRTFLKRRSASSSSGFCSPLSSKSTVPNWKAPNDAASREAHIQVGCLSFQKGTALDFNNSHARVSPALDGNMSDGLTDGRNCLYWLFCKVLLVWQCGCDAHLEEILLWQAVQNVPAKIDLPPAHQAPPCETEGSG